MNMETKRLVLSRNVTPSMMYVYTEISPLISMTTMDSWTPPLQSCSVTSVILRWGPLHRGAYGVDKTCCVSTLTSLVISD